MRVEHLEAGVYEVPTQREAGDSIHRSSAFEWIIVTVRTDDGREGTGWSYTLGEGGAAVKALIDAQLRHLVVGTEPIDVQAVQQRMRRETHVLGSSGVTLLAIAAVDIALWDLLGQQVGLPLYQLLGRHREEIPVYASAMDLNYTVKELVEEKLAFAEQGFTAFKMKTGFDDVREDLHRIRAVREAIGEDAKLMIDENQKWAVPDILLRAKAFEGENLAWIEEPLSADDHDGYEQVARTARLPIAAGETHYTVQQFKDLLRREAVQVLQPDVCRVGGITDWMKIARLAEAWNLPLAPHFVDELHVHLLCAVPNGLLLGYLPVASLNASGMISNPIEMQDGVAAPPSEPGHGLRLDWDALSAHRSA